MSGRALLASLLLALGLPRGVGAEVMTVRELLALPQPPADHRLPYGDDPQQFGDLRLPAGAGPFPVAVLIHGGCWLAPYDLGHLAGLAAALTEAGVATWSLEYRRVGDPGGGYPGTFLDTAAGFEHLREVAARFPLDLGRVVLVGHSAGGHLALWLAGRHRISRGEVLHRPVTVRPLGVVALAPVGDLAAAAALRVCGDAIPRLVGGTDWEFEKRLTWTSPARMLPLGVAQRLVLGDRDTVVPGSLGEAWVRAAAAAGDPVAAVTMAGAGHYELVTPGSAAWPEVRAAVLELIVPP